MYLRDLLVHENFADGILTLHLARDPTIKEKPVNSGRESHRDNSHRDNEGQEEDKIERLEIDDDAFMRFCLTKSNITDYGLFFFFEVIKDLVISKDFIETLYRVIVKVARTKLRPIYPLPEMPQPDAEGNEPSEDEKAAVQKKIEEITKVNAENDKFNDEVVKFQSKVKIAYRAAVDNQTRNECALMRVNNYREQRPEDATAAAAELNQSVESQNISGAKQSSYNVGGKGSQ